MSRIHEALKKAEQERGPVSPLQDIAAAPAEPISTVPEWRTSVPAASTAPVLEPEPLTALRSGYLRFEELQSDLCASGMASRSDPKRFLQPGFGPKRSRAVPHVKVTPLPTPGSCDTSNLADYEL